MLGEGDSVPIQRVPELGTSRQNTRLKGEREAEADKSRPAERQ